jgi:fucose permease
VWIAGLASHQPLWATWANFLAACAFLGLGIVGGAIIPAVMGRISDLSSIQTAFIVPLVCYAYVFYFAIRGHRPQPIGAMS